MLLLTVTIQLISNIYFFTLKEYIEFFVPNPPLIPKNSPLSYFFFQKTKLHSFILQRLFEFNENFLNIAISLRIFLGLLKKAQYK